LYKIFPSLESSGSIGAEEAYPKLDSTLRKSSAAMAEE
jgi:hypothetical protein